MSHPTSLAQFDAEDRARRRKGWLVVLGLLLAAVIGLVLYLFLKPDALTGIDRKPLLPDREAVTTESTNYLLFGDEAELTDAPTELSSVTLLHVPEGSDEAYRVAIPKELLLVEETAVGPTLAEEYTQDIPAAVEKLEDALGITVNHVLLVEPDGFVNLVDEVGGVTIDNPYEGCNADGECYEAGELSFTTAEAEEYIAWGESFGREGSFVAAGTEGLVMNSVLNKLAADGTFENPLKAYEALEKVRDYLVADDTLTDARLVQDLVSLGLTSSKELRAVEAPTDEGREVEGRYALPQSSDLWEDFVDALGQGTIEAYWEAHPVEYLTP